MQVICLLQLGGYLLIDEWDIWSTFCSLVAEYIVTATEPVMAITEGQSFSWKQNLARFVHQISAG